MTIQHAYQAVANARTTRRALFGLAASGAVAGTLAGCSGTSQGQDFGKSSLELPAHVDPKPIPGEIVSDVPGVPPALTKLPSPLPTSTDGVPGNGGEFTTFQVNWGAPPKPESQNKYWQELNKRLGVKYKPTLVPADAYESKLATMLAGGTVPDMVFLHTDSANAQQAIEDGAFAELSGVLGGDKIKKYPNLANVPTFQWEASAVNNGLYGVPTDLAYVNSLHAYRFDWAKKLGFNEAPGDADEFYELMTAMTKGKPEGGRRTFGFGGYSGGVATFINTMFRVPNNWSESGGKLTNMIETDAFEQALTYTRKLWKGGAFHPDALSLQDQGSKDRELFYTGVTGWQVAAGGEFYASGHLRTMVKNNPGAQPKLMLPFGHDGGKYTFPQSPGFYAVVAISAKAAEDADRLDEILRIFNYLRAPRGSAEAFFLHWGLEGVQYTLDSSGAPKPSSDATAINNRGAIAYTGLVPVTFYYPQYPADVKKVVSYTEEVTKNAIPDPTVGLYAPSLANVSDKLSELSTDYTNGIVSGRRPLSDLAKYREDWKSQGGDKVRQEFQEALQAKG